MTKVALHNSVQWLKCVFLYICVCVCVYTNNCTIIRYNDKPTVVNLLHVLSFLRIFGESFNKGKYIKG